MAGPTAYVDFHGNFTPLMRESRVAGTRAGQSLGGGFSRSFGSSLKKVAIGIAGIATVGYGAAKGLGSFVESASTMEETLSKSNTVFGSSAGQIETWSKTAAQSFGQSQQQALEAAGTFGNLFVQLGIGSDEAAKLSKSQVELASDFASFHNTSPEQAIEAMTAAYRGEYDAVQRYVPTISAAAVEQKALEMGLAGTTDELDAQDKALAVQKLLMEGAGDAAGDFGRTSGGLANTQRRLSAVWGDLQANLGQKLLPVVTSVTAFLADNLPSAMTWAGEAARSLGGRLQGLVGPASVVASSVRDGVGTAFQWIAGTAIPWVVDGWGELTAAFQSGSGDGFFGGIGENARTVFEWLTQTAIPGIQSAVGSFMAGIRGEGGEGSFFTDLGEAAVTVAGWFQNTVLPAAQRLFGWLTGEGKPILIAVGVAFAAIAAPVATAIAAFVYAYQRFSWFRTGVETILGAIRGYFENIWLPTFVFMWNAASTYIGYVRGWIETISPVISAVFNVVKFYVQNVWWPTIQTIWTVASTYFGLVWDYITNVLVPVFSTLFDTARTIFTRVADQVQAWWDRASAIFRAFRWGIEVVRKVVEEKVGAVIGFFQELPEKIGDFFSGLAETIKSPFVTAFDAVKEMWNDTVGGFEIPGFDPPGPLKFDGFTIPKMHTGGIVPGRPGQEVLRILEAGEMVIPRNQVPGPDAVPAAAQRPLVIHTQASDPGGVAAEVYWQMATV